MNTRIKPYPILFFDFVSLPISPNKVLYQPDKNKGMKGGDENGRTLQNCDMGRIRRLPGYQVGPPGRGEAGDCDQVEQPGSGEEQVEPE
jgi:hypothetical protein